MVKAHSVHFRSATTEVRKPSRKVPAHKNGLIHKALTLKSPTAPRAGRRAGSGRRLTFSVLSQDLSDPFLVRDLSDPAASTPSSSRSSPKSLSSSSTKLSECSDSFDDKFRDLHFAFPDMHGIPYIGQFRCIDSLNRGPLPSSSLS